MMPIAADAHRNTPTVLVTVTGRDRPGVTSRLFEVLDDYPVEVIDIEQVTVRGQVVLGVLVTAPGAQAASDTLENELREVGRELGLSVGVSSGHGDRRRAPGRAHVNVLGSPLQPSAMASLSAGVNAVGANIDRIHRLASYPVVSIELQVSGVDPAELRRSLASIGAAEGFDVAVQPSGLVRRGKRLVVMDVDSTLVQGDVLELLGAHVCVLGRMADVTARAMRGELDCADSLRARVSMLEGLPASVLDDVRSEVHLTPGARTLVRTVKRLGCSVGIVSGGFSQVTDGLVTELGLDYAAANTLEVVDGQLTGQLVGPILDRAGKAEALARFATDAEIPLAQTVAVGDGANDLDMIAAAGLGVAFNATPAVPDAADTAVNVPYLDTILYLLGISREDIEAAEVDDAVGASID